MTMALVTTDIALDLIKDGAIEHATDVIRQLNEATRCYHAGTDKS